MPNPSNVRQRKGLLRHTLDQLLLVDLFRFVVAAARYVWFARVRHRLRTYDLSTGTASRVAPNTVSHNLRGLRDHAVIRSHLLVRPLSVLEALTVDARILSIGPRSEGELLNLAAHGFLWDHVQGLDLISYSPRVELGDMHAMRFADASFDAIIIGWVLAYSEDREGAAREAVRVVRPGGVIAVGVEHNPLTQQDVVAQCGYRPGAQNRITSCDEILAFFGDAVDHVYYKHIVSTAAQERIGALCVMFSVKK
jgi:SAM-dependent methyltransferase